VSEFEKPSLSKTLNPSVGSVGASRKSPGRPTRDARRGWRIVGYTFGVLACLFSMLLGVVFGTFYWGSETFGRMVRKHGVGVVWDAVVHRDPLLTWTPERQFPDRTSLNVLLLGVDRDYDNRAQIIKTAHGRSDSILLARVDFVNETISALTIPRDTAVRVPGYRGIAKINAAHSYGGPEKTIETIQSVFGVPVDAYVVLNFDGFQKIVDAIGGIDINVEKQMDYDDNWGRLHIHLKPGYQRLNGYQAMGYVRMRHSDSDLMRARRQHAFLEALRTKLKQPRTFLALPGVLDTLNDNLKRNLSEDQLFALANFARSLPKEKIVIETLPVYGGGPSFLNINREKSAEVIQRMFFPNQMVVVNIDAPMVNSTVRSRGRHRRPAARAESVETAPTEETTRAEVTEPAPMESPDSGLSETPAEDIPPPPADSNSPDNGRTDSGETGAEETSNAAG